jgi:hypothetical protein
MEPALKPGRTKHYGKADAFAEHVNGKVWSRDPGEDSGAKVVPVERSDVVRLGDPERVPDLPEPALEEGRREKLGGTLLDCLHRDVQLF